MTDIVSFLEWRAEYQPEQIAYTFLESSRPASTLSYGQLAQRARAIAGELSLAGSPGDHAMVLCPPGLDFVAAFFGCLYAGFIAVPSYPLRAGQSTARFQSIAASAKPSVVLATTAVIDRMARAGVTAQGVAHLPVDAPPRDGPTPNAVRASAGQPAVLQYTSGSTSDPRGVMVTHGNLIGNSREISRLFECGPESRGVVWLPFYHDMGLVGGIIQPLYAGFPMTLMSPLSFLQSPFEWLHTISETGATVSGGPNFAFDLCVERVSSEELPQLDLSRWRVAFNGAEPIRPETLERFTSRFSPCGFRMESFSPCYGLAEATLLVCGIGAGAAPMIETFDRAGLEQRRAEPPGNSDGHRLVSCGHAIGGLTVRIVDPATAQPCEANEIGEIWVAGDSVAQGYWDQQEETERCFGARIGGNGDDPFLRTGDLGFVHDGQIFVTGRIKDLIIIRGLNHYPQDIELSAERAHPALQPHGCVAFTADADSGDRLVIVGEVPRNTRGPALAEAAAAVREAVASDHALQVHDVALVRRGALPRTTSGKIQRHLCREQYLAGDLKTVATSRLETEPPAPQPPTAQSPPVLPAHILSVLPGQQQPLLRAYLRGQVAHALRLGEPSVATGKPLGQLGMDSLGATRLRHLIETDLGVVVPLDYLLSSPTTDELVARLSAALQDPPERPIQRAGPPADGRPGHPLSAGQAAMWFLHQLAPDSGAFTIACALRVTAAVDASRLQRAFEVLIDHHPILRTTYRTIDAEPVQVVGDRPGGWFRHHDAAGWSGNQILAGLSDTAGRRFDLARGPVMRVDLFSRANNDHILLLTVHHVAADFWSVEVLLHELGELYRLNGAAAAPEDPLPARYVDFTAWQGGLLAGPEGDRLWAYWRQVLGGELPVLQLPTDRPRPPVQTYSGAIERFTLDPELTGRLIALTAEHGVTLYVALLAAFNTLLHRYSGQTDIIVGAPFAARSRAALAGLVGYVVNTVPLRVSLAGDPSFVELLGRVHTAVTQGLAHQDFPFAAMVEHLGVARDPARSPIFQVAFTFQQSHLPGGDGLAAVALGTPALQGRIGDLPVESLPLPRQASQFDLSLQLAETGDGMAGSLVYNTDLFDAATAAQMTGHLRGLLTAATAAPGRRISALPMVRASAADGGWAATGTGPTPVLVHRLIEAQAARSPHATAVIDAAGTLTYRDLNSAANRLARHLQQLGAGRGSLVGIMLERGASQILAILAVMKAGAAYVPIDPAYPLDRLTFMFDDAKISLVLTQESLRELAPPGQVASVAMDTADLAGLAREDLDDLAGPHDLACVLYTSGSTGQPKGVMITHAGLSTQVRALTTRLRVTPADRHLLTQSLAFAASVRQITVPLCNGAAVVVGTSSQVADIPALFALIRDTDVSMMSANPAFWQHCVEGLTRLPAQARRALLDNRLRLLLSASEPLTPDVPRWWQAELGPRAEFVNMLGHTEVSGIATIYPVPAGDGRALPTVPVGVPLPGIGVRILNESLEPVPDGVAGEMFLTGPALTSGYLRQAGLTAERVLPDPHSDRPGQRLYRTGDLVRRAPDGVLHHLGRIDDQLKVRGFRIEPAEVEAALTRHPDVRASVVTAYRDKGGQQRLVAYIVPSEHSAPTASELRRHLRALLPDYLVPSLFEMLDSLPLNANGKVARRDLPTPSEARPVLDDEFVPPSSSLEWSLAAIWAEVLKVAQVGVHDSFFDLGGTSLSLMSVHELLQERLGIELLVAKLFQYPTVHTLARHLSEAEPVASHQIARGRATGSRRRRLLDDARARTPRRTVHGKGGSGDELA